VRESERCPAGRFPVLEQHPTASQLVKLHGAIRNLDSKIEHYRVAMPGRACTPGSAGATQDCKSAIDHGSARYAIDQQLREFATIDVMFLIDATTSMDPYFPAARQGVQKFVREMNTDGLTIRVGAAIYGDYETDVPDTKAMQYATIVSLTQPSSPDFGRLGTVTLYIDKHADNPEASFAAIIRTANNPYWNPNAGVRYIVHIGDHGNRVAGKTSGTGKSTLLEKYTESHVVEALKKNRIVYVPIAVRGTYRAENNQAFVAQANEIHRLAPSFAAPMTMTYRETQTAEERPEDRIEAVHKALVASVQIARSAVSDANRRIACAQDPTSGIC